MHELLERQLRELGSLPSDAGFEKFLAAVDAAYVQADREREAAQRSLEQASQELFERNRELRQDVERRNQLELELAQAEKLRAVGQLASGIAHELNTPIQYVGDNLAFLDKAFRTLAGLIEGAIAQQQGPLRKKLDFLRDNIPGALQAALEGCGRVAEVVSAMKAFAHADDGEFAAADINGALSATLAVARNAIRFVADVQLELGELPLVECRIGDLNQVFLNLLTNATHAITDRYGASGQRGRLLISTRHIADRVVVEVSDDGCGIARAIQARIFEPFFTTREVGRGSGQGLAISRSIVTEHHGGALYFRTAPGQGTTFIVEVPVQRRSGLRPCAAEPSLSMPVGEGPAEGGAAETGVATDLERARASGS